MFYIRKLKLRILNIFKAMVEKMNGSEKSISERIKQIIGIKEKRGITDEDIRKGIESIKKISAWNDEILSHDEKSFHRDECTL